jgi:hypothetical protein
MPVIRNAGETAGKVRILRPPPTLFMLTLSEIMSINKEWVTKTNIENDDCVSFWSKKAFKELEKRDLCNVLDDLEMLTIYFEKQFEKLSKDFVQWS